MANCPSGLKRILYALTTVPAEIPVPSGGMGMVWCYLKPLNAVIRKTTSCLINTKNKPQKWRQRVTVLVGMSNSLNTALAIKFLTRLKPPSQRLHYPTISETMTTTYTHLSTLLLLNRKFSSHHQILQWQRSVEAAGSAGVPVVTEALAGTRRSSRQQGGEHGGSETSPTWSVWFPRAARLWMTF